MADSLVRLCSDKHQPTLDHVPISLFYGEIGYLSSADNRIRFPKRCGVTLLIRGRTLNLWLVLAVSSNSGSS